MTGTSLTPLEVAAIEALIEDDDSAELLHRQLSRCRVTNRRFTDMGVWTYLDVGTVPTAESSEIVRDFGDEGILSPVHADIEGLENGVTFALYLASGKLEVLEMWTTEEPVPASLERFTILTATS